METQVFVLVYGCLVSSKSSIISTFAIIKMITKIKNEFILIEIINAFLLWDKDYMSLYSYNCFLK